MHMRSHFIVELKSDQVEAGVYWLQLVEIHLHAVVEQLAASLVHKHAARAIDHLAGNPAGVTNMLSRSHVRHICHKPTHNTATISVSAPNQHISLICKPDFPHFCLPKPPVEKSFSVHKYLSLVSHVIKFDQHADVSCALAASAMPTLSGTACSSFHIATNTNCTHQRPGG